MGLESSPTNTSFWAASRKIIAALMGAAHQSLNSVTGSPMRQLNSVAVRCILTASRELKMEILGENHVTPWTFSQRIYNVVSLVGSGFSWARRSRIGGHLRS
jgi:hypothetical protein